jgi:hypothetical protein
MLNIRKPSTLSRRRALKGAGAAILGVLLPEISAFPAVHAQQEKVLRYLGTAVNQSPDIAKKVKEDTGITHLHPRHYRRRDAQRLRSPTPMTSSTPSTFR